MKPFAESCAENQAPILEVLRDAFKNVRQVLEIGSGTGQHAVYFGQHLPHLKWLTSDLSANHAGIQMWLDEAALSNVMPPVEIDVNQQPWPVTPVDGVFTANTLHIVSWPAVVNMFEGVAKVLQAGGVMCVYGPFNYGGQFTSPSNARFDQWLKSRDPASGVRDMEAVREVAAQNGLQLTMDHSMPVNNRTLIFHKVL